MRLRVGDRVSDPRALAGMMEKIECRCGHTQIGRVLAHAKRETGILKVAALVFIGDAMEESADDLRRIRCRAPPARCSRLHVPGRQ